MDWYHDSEHERKATLRVGKELYPVELEFGIITKLIINQSVAAWVDGMEAEVLKVNENEVVVQGEKTTVLHVAKEGSVKDYVLEFGTTPQVRVVIAERNGGMIL